MHGSPLSKFDNRDIWKKYNYRDLGIIGEPYFDLDFTRVAYLTDTGRMWDGERYSIRDRVTRHPSPVTRHHSTADLIRSLESGIFPQQAMITFHPQRWTDNPALWLQELIWQRMKNGVKFFLARA